MRSFSYSAIAIAAMCLSLAAQSAHASPYVSPESILAEEHVRPPALDEGTTSEQMQGQLAPLMRASVSSPASVHDGFLFGDYLVDKDDSNVASSSDTASLSRPAESMPMPSPFDASMPSHSVMLHRLRVEKLADQRFDFEFLCRGSSVGAPEMQRAGGRGAVIEKGHQALRRS